MIGSWTLSWSWAGLERPIVTDIGLNLAAKPRLSAARLDRAGQAPASSHISRQQGPRIMSALANHPFVKMNGIGNEIVVVDRRRKPLPISAGEARAVASPQGAHYDQLMALYPAEVAGTDARIRIFNNDGSYAGACGNGMRCVASLLF